MYIQEYGSFKIWRRKVQFIGNKLKNDLFGSLRSSTFFSHGNTTKEQITILTAKFMQDPFFAILIFLLFKFSF